MVNINEDVAVRLKAELFKINKTFGSKSTVKTVSDLANTILTKYLEKKEKVNKEPGNKGIPWVQFRRSNFNEIWMRDRGRCHYCNCKLTKDKCTLDHKIPAIRGGQNTVENVCLSCEWCNSDKTVLTPEEYYYKQLHNAAQGIYPKKD